MKLTTNPGNRPIHGLRWLLAAAAALAFATQASAQLTTVGPGAFSASATTLTFEDLSGSDNAPLPTYHGVTLNGGTIVQLYSDYGGTLVAAAGLAGLGSVATLSQWSLAILSGLLALGTVLALRRRRR
jgi:hypothetical protein